MARPSIAVESIIEDRPTRRTRRRISHPEAERILSAAKQGRVAWAMVDGYGVGAVKAGLERFVKPASKAG